MIGSKVVHQVVGRFVNTLGGFILFKSNGAEGGDEFVVYCSGMA